MILTKYVIYRGKTVEVDKLKPNSHIKINVQCPICGEIREVSYKEIIKNGHHMCQKCALRKKNYIPLEIGEKFNKWTVIDKGTEISHSLCRCECGTIREVDNYSLKSGISKSCGCIVSENNKKRRKYLQIGMIYGKLKIIAHSSTSGYSICQCECGNKCTVSNFNLEKGYTKSCGCIQKEIVSKKMTLMNFNKTKNKHWNWKGGISDKRKCDMQSYEYKNWRKNVFERDDYTCQCCGQVGYELNAHHIQNYADNEDLQVDLNNGITLCEECHRRFHHEYGYKYTNKEQLINFINEMQNNLLSDLNF